MGGAGSLFGVLGIAAVFVMRFKHPTALRPYRVWGYPWVPAAHLLGSLAIFVDLLIVKTSYSVFGLVIVSGAIPIYLWRKKRNANPQPDAILAMNPLETVFSPTLDSKLNRYTLMVLTLFPDIAGRFACSSKIIPCSEA
jgi:hypothetical protein